MANNDAVLAELEAQLRAPDSILEPGVLDLLKEYLRAGGKPQAVIEDLSENYCGVYSTLKQGAPDDVSQLLIMLLLITRLLCS
jgi:hypothetical protein